MRIELVNRYSLLPVASIASILMLSGCSAPMGPLGGIDANRYVMKHCLCHGTPTGSICDENDPNIVPPHANFHPLPTRPVFSPPTTVSGIYNPWPDPPAQFNQVPTKSADSQPEATEVRAVPQRPGESSLFSSAEYSTAAASAEKSTSASAPNQPSGDVTLRR
jgi:hypothetical protein